MNSRMRKGGGTTGIAGAKHRDLFLLSLPALLLTLVFSYLPLLGLPVAFKKFRFDRGIFGSAWNGFDNFKFFFVSDNAWRVTRNTLLYNAGFIVITLVCALALAVLLSEMTGRAVKVYQTTLFLPHFLSWVVVGYIVLALLEPGRGLMDEVMRLLGREAVNWYQDAGRWPYILNAVNLWKTVGFSTLVYYAGILGINPAYYEAAEIDGAGRLQMAWRITLPLLAPLIIVLLIVAVGGIFRADFGLFYFVPNNSSFLYSTTDVIDTYVFRALRTIGDVGMSAAVGLYQSIVGFVLVVATNALIRRVNADHALW
ncbi:ABC transporter permease [Paenibacillaceae bacterium WGS1546]|uniref:ABC transporter permease n=1 Tax=Cohnella sp. WGS1546 TaxID=3366810 RepID=UPI00372D31A0